MSTEFFNDQWRIPSNENQSLVSNYSMEFDGTSNKIELRNSSSTDTSLNLTPNASISAWIYKTSVNNYGCVYANSRGNSGYFGFSLLVNNLNKLQLRCNLANSIFTSLATVPNNEWVHVAGTYKSGSSSEVKLSINGVIETFTAIGVQPPLNYTNPAVSSGVEIGGGLLSGSSLNWYGEISDVSLFNGVLTSTQIETLYGGGTAVTNPMALSPKPVSYYGLGDQSAYNGANYLVPNNSLQDYALDFDGTNDYIDCGSFTALNSGTAMTVSLWFKGSAYITNARLIRCAQFEIYQSTATYSNTQGRLYYKPRKIYGNPIVTLGGTSASGVGNMVNGNWHHICLTFDNSTTTTIVYEDGNSVISNTTTGGTLNPSATNLYISSGGATLYNSGSISNVSVWNTALTSAQVTEIYNSGVPSNLNTFSGTAPASWWKLNAQDTFDGTNWTINDYAGSNDGTSINMSSANLVQSNLQHTSGYSPYALDFDGVNDELDFNNASANIMANKNTISISGWFKLNSNTTSTVFSNWHGSPQLYLLRYNTGAGIQWYINSGSGSTILNTLYFPNVGDWVHVVAVKDPITNGGQSRVYVNGFEYTKDSTNLSVAMSNNSRPDQIGVFGTSSRMNGSISNVAYWTNTALTQAQVTEIYNQGVPSNLNTFSGTSPDHWLQLGSNSSFNTNWTCLDEIGTNNAVSAGAMTNDDIVNGVGYSGNGLGTSTIDIIGDAPYSTANGLSENMDVLDRVTDVPS